MKVDLFYIFFGYPIFNTSVTIQDTQSINSAVICTPPFSPFIHDNKEDYFIHQNEVDEIIQELRLSSSKSYLKFIIFPTGTSWELGAIKKIVEQAGEIYMVPGYIDDEKIIFLLNQLTFYSLTPDRDLIIVSAKFDF